MRYECHEYQIIKRFNDNKKSEQTTELKIIVSNWDDIGPVSLIDLWLFITDGIVHHLLGGCGCGELCVHVHHGNTKMLDAVLGIVRVLDVHWKQTTIIISTENCDLEITWETILKSGSQIRFILRPANKWSLEHGLFFRNKPLLVLAKQQYDHTAVTLTYLI